LTKSRKKPAASPYIGRFAPSPTGLLHFGSLVAALASYVVARAHHGRWYVRIENIDPPREVSGAADAILHALEAYGLWWDGAVVYQLEHQAMFESALSRLFAANQAYYCTCTRSQLQSFSVYPGFCRDTYQSDGAVRLRVEPGEVVIRDRYVGEQRWDRKHIGDFVIRRRDGLFAYQLAVVLDDAALGVTEVVRGRDLLDETPKQIVLQQMLGLPTPEYAHIPLVVNETGQKLSKQNLAPALGLSEAEIVENLWQAFRVLGLVLPHEERCLPVRELLTLGVAEYRAKNM
jgi:glutamyl-Q tRNA(Asp) synthetase